MFSVRYKLNRLNITLILGSGFGGLKGLFDGKGRHLSVQTLPRHKRSVMYWKFIYALVHIFIHTTIFIAYDEKGNAYSNHTIKL
jgi:hypothetical protein